MDTDFELRQQKVMWQPQPIDPCQINEDLPEQCVCDYCNEIVNETYGYHNGEYYCFACLEKVTFRDAGKYDEEEEAALVDFEGAVDYLKY